MYLLIVVPKYVRWSIRFGAIGPADFQSRRLIRNFSYSKGKYKIEHIIIKHLTRK